MPDCLWGGDSDPNHSGSLGWEAEAELQPSTSLGSSAPDRQPFWHPRTALTRKRLRGFCPRSPPHSSGAASRGSGVPPGRSPPVPAPASGGGAAGLPAPGGRTAGKPCPGRAGTEDDPARERRAGSSGRQVPPTGRGHPGIPVPAPAPPGPAVRLPRALLVLSPPSRRFFAPPRTLLRISCILLPSPLRSPRTLLAHTSLSLCTLHTVSPAAL